jgi:hypothetical protein
MKFKEMLEMANKKEPIYDSYEMKLNAEYKTKMEGATSEMKVKYETELKTKMDEYKKSKMEKQNEADPIVEAKSISKDLDKAAEDIEKISDVLYKLMPEIKKYGSVDAGDMKKFEKVLGKHFDDITDMIVQLSDSIDD